MRSSRARAHRPVTSSRSGTAPVLGAARGCARRDVRFRQLVTAGVTAFFVALEDLLRTLHVEESPRAARTAVHPAVERAQVEALGGRFWRVVLRCGSMERSDVPAALAGADLQGLRVPMFEAGWFLSRNAVGAADVLTWGRDAVRHPAATEGVLAFGRA